MAKIRAKVSVIGVDVDPLRRFLNKKLQRIRKQMVDRVLPNLKTALNVTLKERMGPLVDRLATQRFDLISLGAFGIPREGGPEIHPKQFNDLIKHPGVTQIIGGKAPRLQWFDFSRAITLTQYVWTGTTNEEVSWIGLIEKGHPAITGYTFVGRSGAGRSSFGHMIRGRSSSELSRRGSTRNVIPSWGLTPTNIIKDISNQTKEIETFLRTELNATIAREFRSGS